MSPRTPQTIGEAIQKAFTATIYNKIAIKRSYDEWFIKQFWSDYRNKLSIRSQKLDASAHQALGSDISVSKFVLGRGGRVQDLSGKWYSKFKHLPPTYSKSFKVTAIEISRRGIVTEGVDNFVGLEHLEFIDLSLNPKLDDFACDQLSRQFRHSKTLREIDLSFNPLISVYGLEILFRIPSIKRIVALDTAASKFPNIDLFVLAAEEERDCEVLVHSDGRKYMNQDLEDLRKVGVDKRIPG